MLAPSFRIVPQVRSPTPICATDRPDHNSFDRRRRRRHAAERHVGNHSIPDGSQLSRSCRDDVFFAPKKNPPASQGAGGFDREGTRGQNSAAVLFKVTRRPTGSGFRRPPRRAPPCRRAHPCQCRRNQTDRPVPPPTLPAALVPPRPA